MAPPHGDLARHTRDIVLLGYNPQLDGYAKDAQGNFAPLPGYPEWRRDGATAFARALDGRLAGRARAGPDGWAKRIRPLLPDGYHLLDGRIVNTRVWKWPTYNKDWRVDEPFVRRCVERHLRDELAALRPRLIISYELQGSEFVRDVLMDEWNVPRGAWRTAPAEQMEALGTLEPSPWPWGTCGAVLLRTRRVYRRETAKWTRDTGARFLAS